MATKTIRYLKKTRSEESKKRRRQFAKDIWEKVRPKDKKSARARKTVWKKDSAGRLPKDRFRFMGHQYRAGQLFQEGVLGTRIPNFLKKVIRRKGKSRILDIGSGKGLYWHSLPKLLGFEAESIQKVEAIELHTLNPSNWYRGHIPTSRAKQHVGTAETKNLAKLGRFDAITAFYTIGHLPADFNQAIIKLSKQLSVGGRLFVVFGHKIQGDTSNRGIRNTFGKSFKIRFLRRERKKGATYNNGLVVERIS